MRLLLDTHIYLWFVRDDPKLGRGARNRIRDADEVFVSSASMWEIAIKASLGKLGGDVATLSALVQNSGFKELSIRSVHAVQVRNLPLFHCDPFDRMLVAQAIFESMQLLTADRHLKKYTPLVIAQ
jgi:PIN domain nuclease of toxin-antitoxin system